MEYGRGRNDDQDMDIVSQHSLLMQHHVDNSLSTPPNSAARDTLYALAADYAEKHGVTLDILKRWKWEPVFYQQRPALTFITAKGRRWRFLDNDKQKKRYTSESDYELCWYGLDSDVIASVDDESPLIICNGEISTVTAQTYLLLAVCITSGEKGRIPHNLLDELKQKLAPGTKIIVAFDCDPTGRKKGPLMAAQLREEGYNAWAVDLGLGDKGDLADFCMMHGSDAYERLMQCPVLEIPESEKPAFTPRVMPAVSKPANISSDAQQAADKRIAAWFKKKWDGIIHTLETTSRGRNEALHDQACYLFNLVYSYPQYGSESAAYDALYQASVINGYLAKDGAFQVRNTLKSAQAPHKRKYVDLPFDPYDNPETKKSAQAEKGKNLTYYDDPFGEGVPMQAPRHEDADKRDDILSRYSSQLPDSWMFALEDAAKGGYAPGLINAINGAMRRGELKVYTSDAAYTTIHAIIEGLETAGYTLDKDTIKTALKRIVAAGLIEKMPKRAKGVKSAHYKKDIYTDINQCALFAPLGSNEHVYRLLDDEALLKIIKERLLESLLDSFYPHKAEIIDAERAALLSPAAIQCTLEALQTRKLNKLSAESVYADVPDTLKVQVLSRDDVEGRTENTRRKAAFYSVLRAIEAPATRNNLMAYDVPESQAQALAEQINTRKRARDPHNLIGLKWALLLSAYERSTKKLQDTRTTPFAEMSLDTAKAQLNALRRARHAPYDNQKLTGYKQAELLNTDSRAAAVRMSKRLGLRRELVEPEMRLLDVKHGDIQRAIKSTVKAGEKALKVISFNASGQPIDSAYLDDAEGISKLKRGAALKVMVQTPSILRIEPMPARPERAAKAAPAAADVIAMPESTSRRVYRTTLYTREWIEYNVLEPVCFNAENGVWFNPFTGECHETREAALSDLIHMASTEFQAVS